MIITRKRREHREERELRGGRKGIRFRAQTFPYLTSSDPNMYEACCGKYKSVDDGIIVFILIHLSSYPEVKVSPKSQVESNKSQSAEPSFHLRYHSCMAAVHCLSAPSGILSSSPSSNTLICSSFSCTALKS